MQPSTGIPYSRRAAPALVAGMLLTALWQTGAVEGVAAPHGPDLTLGEDWVQRDKLMASDRIEGEFDELGWSVALDGDTALALACRADGGSSAYVFTRAVSVWSEQAKLTPFEEPACGFLFPGFIPPAEVALAGDTAVLGFSNFGPNHPEIPTPVGTIVVFARSGDQWSQQAELAVPDFARSFGQAVALDGDTVVVGATNDAPSPRGDGFVAPAAYVFTRTGEDWTQQAELIPSGGGTPGLVSGHEVAVHGDTVLIAVPTAPEGSGGGAVYVFTRTDGVWSEEGQLIPSDGAPNLEWGWSLAIDGDTAAVGTRRSVTGTVGAVYLFTRDSTTGEWSEQAKLTSPLGADDNFGEDVAVEGDTLVVGTGFTSPSADAVFVYGRSGKSWTQHDVLTPADGAPGGPDLNFGQRVALDGDTIVVGTYLLDSFDIPSMPGSAYVFDTREPAPALGLSPPFLDFGGVVLGETSEAATVTVQNNGSDDLELGDLALSGDDAADFTMTGDACSGQSLAAGEACTVEIEFSPSVLAVHVAELEVPSNAPTTSDSLPIRGEGIAELPPVLAFTPSQLDFGGVEVGSTSPPQVATLQNTGEADATNVSFDLPGGGFDADTSACPATLSSGESCEVTVTFTPPVPGPAAATLAAGSDEGVSAVLSLQGNGILTELSFNPPSLDFGDVDVGTTSPPQTAALQNTGEIDLTSLGFLLGGSAAFQVDTSACGSTLPAGESCDVVVLFAPSLPGPAAGTVEGRSAEGASALLSLTGNGAVPDPPRIEVDPTALSAALEPGESETHTLTVANLGELPLEWEVVEDLAPDGDEQITVTHSDSLSVAAGNTAVCANKKDGTTVENRVLRVFRLADFGITSGFDVSHVSFGVQTLTASASITVNLYTLEGELTFDNLTLIGTATEELAPQDLTLATAPVSAKAPADATLVVEVAAPDLSGVAAFIPGSNGLGESAPSYLAAPACGLAEPTPFAHIGFPNVRLVMTVTGAADVIDCALPAWAGVEPDGGSVPGGEDRAVHVTFDATEAETGDHAANLCLSGNDPDRLLTVVPLALSVTSGDAALTFDPPNVDFGEVAVGSTSPPEVVTLQNVGDVEVTGLTFSDLSGSDFHADTSGCPGALDAGESCDLTVTFTPLASGPAAVTLDVISDQDASAGLGLAGKGFGPGGFSPTALEVDPPLLASSGNGVFEPGESVVVAPAWRNDGDGSGGLMGIVSSFTGPEGADYGIELDVANYGSLEPGQTASCLDTDVCYQLGLDDPAVRPATHWEATFDETLDDSDDTTKTWTLHIGESFTDVPTTNLFYSSIETLLHGGVTGGCDEGAYCPDGVNSRSQMPVFVLRTLEGAAYAPEPCVDGDEEFADVPAASPFCRWIEELFRRDVISGCGGGNYCPASPVTRAQMAIFLLKTLEGGDYTPPGCSGTFDDVPCSSLFADWIEELAERGVTGGCGADPPTYCPAAPVTRAQMAVFVTKTFGLTLYGP